ncbi:hypothetical protein LX36DRAFT_138850 [Colletotrichum falcatum]|nr:hypothetical protein LX36DRAFT_138850 [Colletotrichum falcatum]
MPLLANTLPCLCRAREVGTDFATYLGTPAASAPSAPVCRTPSRWLFSLRPRWTKLCSRSTKSRITLLGPNLLWTPPLENEPAPPSPRSPLVADLPIEARHYRKAHPLHLPILFCLSSIHLPVHPSRAHPDREAVTNRPKSHLHRHSHDLSLPTSRLDHSWPLTNPPLQGPKRCKSTIGVPNVANWPSQCPGCLFYMPT